MATSSINREITSCRVKGKCVSNRRKREAFRAQKCNPYAFLNETIQEIACSEVAPTYIFGGSISWESNLQYLEASARKWCELHGKQFSVDHSDNPITMMTNIYNVLCGLTDDYRFDYDIDKKDKMIKLIEYRACDFPSSTVFYLPVKYINDFKGAKMRELMLRFYSFIYYNSLFIPPEECFDFIMLYDIPYEEGEDERDKGMKEMIESYKNGKAKALFDEVIRVPSANRTPSSILSLINSLSDTDKRIHDRLIKHIKEGLSLLKEDDLNNHAYFEGYCSDERFDTRQNGDCVAIERLFVLCYDVNEEEDPLSSNAMYCLSEEANNLDIQYFRDSHYLSPDDTEIFEPSTYPREWADWFGELINILVI